MSFSSVPCSAAVADVTHVAPWYRDRWLALVVVAWCGLIAARLTTLTVRGEESRWARGAYEMLQTGDYLVSRQQGIPFPNRPPMAEWTIVLSSQLYGDMTTAAIRTPAILGVLLAAVTVYFFTRRFLSACGAAAAAIAFLSFGQVLQLGRLAESEGIFVGAVAAGMLGWHLGYRSGRPAWQVWCWAYFWATVAGLTKGPQGPVYVCNAIGLYLLLRRDWKYLISFGHVAGLGLFALLFGGWYVACGLVEGFDVARTTLFKMVDMRLANRGSLPLHMLRYPWLVLAALLPWSPLLVRYLYPRFLAELGPARDGVVFCAAAIAATFPSMWFIYGTVSRHYFSLYPCFAVLVGVVLDRCFTAAAGTSLADGWKLFSRTLALVVGGSAIVMTAAPWLDAAWADRVVQPWPFTLVFVVVACITGTLLLRSTHAEQNQDAMQRVRFSAFAAVVVVIGLAFVGASLNTLSKVANDHESQTLAVKQLLPPGAKLVSFGPLEHVFTFDYREPITQLPWPLWKERVPSDVEYFAFTPESFPPTNAPADWEQIAVVVCDRNVKELPERAVVIGRIKRPLVAQRALLDTELLKPIAVEVSRRSDADSNGDERRRLLEEMRYLR